jgi:C-terminal processing protease CtpA/Prc
MRRIATLFLLVIATNAFAADRWHRPDPNGRCPEGKPLTGDIGIGYLICFGGACMVNERDGGGYRHSFSSEPTIASIGSGSPAAGILRESDVIVSVDGALITTREGGRRLASLTPDVPVRLRVRRGSIEREEVLVPIRGCNMPSLTVTSRAKVSSEMVEQPAQAPIDFGMQLDCNECGWRREGGRLVWRADDFPRVVSVLRGGPAERAGIQPGDVLLRIGEHSIVDARAGETLASLPPGRGIPIQIVRGGNKLVVNVVPR